MNAATMRALPDLTTPLARRGWPPTGADDVAAIMTTDFARVPLQMSVEGLTDLLLRRDLGAAVVVDHDEELVGAVSIADLLREVQDRGDDEEWTSLPSSGPSDDRELRDGFHGHHLARATVEEIMTPLALSVTEDTSIRHAVALMGYEGVAQLPVVSADRHVVGVVTALDVLRWMGRPRA